MHGGSGQKPPLWAGGGGNYESEKASELIENAKGFRERLKNKGKKPLPSDEEGDKMTVGRIKGRIPIYRHFVVARKKDMPEKGTEKYNAALVRLLEFLDEIQPQETGYLAVGDEADHWPHRNQFLQDGLVGRPDPAVSLKKYQRSSEKVSSATTILTRLIQRYHEYATAHDGDFRLQDPVWKRFGDQFEKSKEEKFRATTIEKAFYSDLLIGFPVAKRKKTGGGLNSIMQFVSWFYQHVWEEWTDDKRMFHSKICRFAGVPDINSWNAPMKGKKGDSELWLSHNWEWTLKDRIKARLDMLWKAVSFTKRALDFAVVDADSPLKATPELQAVLQKWIDMTTGKFGMLMPGANGAAMDMDVEDDKGNPWDGAVGDGSEEEEENAPSTSSRKISKHKSNIRKAMDSSDEDDD